jgi:hypothetical protein
MEPLKDEERRRDAELEALCRKITEENPGYFDRLADRIIAEAKAEGAAFRWKSFLEWVPTFPQGCPRVNVRWADGTVSVNVIWRSWSDFDLSLL